MIFEIGPSNSEAEPNDFTSMFQGIFQRMIKFMNEWMNEWKKELIN